MCVDHEFASGQFEINLRHGDPVDMADRLTLFKLGLQEKITPLTDGAGIAEVLAQGRVIGPDGTPVPIAIRFLIDNGMTGGDPSTVMRPARAFTIAKASPPRNE